MERLLPTFAYLRPLSYNPNRLMNGFVVARCHVIWALFSAWRSLDGTTFSVVASVTTCLGAE
jgi:hypothetical protein